MSDVGRLRQLAQWVGLPLLTEKRQASTLRDPTKEIMSVLGAETSSGIVVGDDRARTISAVYACVDLISKTIATLPARVYRKTAKGREEQTWHPANRLLRVQPNDRQTPFQFRAYMQACLCQRGNAFAFIERNTYFEPTALVPVRPANVEIIETRSGKSMYRIDGREYDSTRMLHVPAVQTHDGVTGIAPVTAMRETLGLALATQEHGARTFRNGAAPGGVIETPAGTNPDQVEKLRLEWDRNHRGISNTGRPAILYGGMQFKSVGFNNEDAQFLESRRFEVEEIARFYGVPLALIQSTEKSTSWGSGIQQLIEGFVKFTLAPIVVNWEQRLSAALLTEEQLAAGFYVRLSLDGLLRGDQKARYDAYAVGRQWGWLNANDIRRLEEMDDLPDAQGGIYLHPANMTPAGMVPRPVPANAPAEE